MGLNTYIKSVIELTDCPIHHQQPILTIIDKRITMECCCLDFKISCFKEMVRLFTEEKEDAERSGSHKYDLVPVTTPTPL